MGSKVVCREIVANVLICIFILISVRTLIFLGYGFARYDAGVWSILPRAISDAASYFKENENPWVEILSLSQLVD